MRAKFVLLVAASLSPALALAHPGHETVSGFLAGVMHPWSGLDHMAAMVAAGLWAGGKRRALLHTLFVMTVVGIAGGTLLGVSGDILTAPERVVAISAVVLGLLVATAVARVRSYMVVALITLFCFFHGYVHAIETPRQLAQLDFTSGFVVSMLALQITGVMFAAKLLRGHLAVRGAAACCAAAGLIALF
jgi:urease accessory protein